MEEVYAIELNKDEIAALKRSGSKVFKVNDQDDLKSEAIVEGLLYIAGEEGLKAAKLAVVMECDEDSILSVLKLIQKKYERNDRGIMLVNYAANYKFVTKDAVYPFAQKLLNNAKPQSLSPSAMETLAIIAYKQPITRVEIEELRGLPPALVITDANDVLRDEGEAYAEKLMQADVPVTAVRYLGAMHDFMMLNAVSKSHAADAAMKQTCRALKRALHRS